MDSSFNLNDPDPNPGSFPPGFMIDPALLTNDGRDTLTGGTGADPLDGGTNTDLLFGAAGNDRRFGGGTGNDP